jgi:four helix bundle protein
MSTATRFEDLLCWQRARELTREIYRATRKGEFRRDFELSNQIRKASTSTMANIVEGFGRQGNREFLRFLKYAKGSAEEVQSLLYVVIDAGFVSQDAFNRLYGLADEVARMLAGLMKNVQRRIQNERSVGRKSKG